jgi:excinuclease ABC subunit B
VILYADKVTKGIRWLQTETKRRRAIQNKYNEEHGITPETIYKTVEEVIAATSVADSKSVSMVSEKRFDSLSKMEKEELIEVLEREMLAASERLEFERAAELRDEIELLRGRKTKKTGRFRYPRRRK